MKRIAFICDLEEGHFLPTFALAHDLKKRGHDIFYLSVVDNQQIIEEQGFRFYCLFGDLYPKGSKQKMKIKFPLTDEEEISTAQSRQKKHVEYLLTKDAYGLIRKLKADLVLISFYLPFDIFILYYKYGIRPVLVNPILREPDQLLSQFLEEFLKTLYDELRLLFLNFVSKLNLDLSSLHQLTAPLDSLHEIIFCPGELDFDSPLKDLNVHYIGPSIRNANPCFDVYNTYNIPPSKKIIYASMGSQGIRHGQNCALFFEKAINIMKETDCCDLHLIACVGSEFDQSKLGVIPENVTLLGWGPQIDILRQSSVAIIHGGLGGIKECIYYGVPMIILAQGYDQPQNARRILYHGLGLAADIETITECELKMHVLNILHCRKTGSNICRMKKIFHDREAQRVGANLIENMLGIA